MKTSSNKCNTDCILRYCNCNCRCCCLLLRLVLADGAAIAGCATGLTGSSLCVRVVRVHAGLQTMGVMNWGLRQLCAALARKAICSAKGNELLGRLCWVLPPLLLTCPCIFLFLSDCVYVCAHLCDCFCLLSFPNNTTGGGKTKPHLLTPTIHIFVSR